MSAMGLVLFRNNCGTALAPDGSGRRIKYGVANPGGADLIGWESIEITPEMVGSKVAVFAAIECKGEGAEAVVTANQLRSGSQERRRHRWVRKLAGGGQSHRNQLQTAKADPKIRRVTYSKMITQIGARAYNGGLWFRIWS